MSDSALLSLQNGSVLQGSAVVEADQIAKWSRSKHFISAGNARHDPIRDIIW